MTAQRLSRRAVSLGAASLFSVKAARAQTSTSLTLLRPGPTSVATHNQAISARATAASIDDDAMILNRGPQTFEGIAPGMRNVAIVIRGAWTIAVPRPDGRFSATVDLSSMDQGPFVADIYAWDVPPDTHVFSVSLALRVHLFIKGDGRKADAARSAPHPAAGRELVWEECFDDLSPSRWYAGPKPDGQQYGMAAFLGFDAVEGNPYRVLDHHLRIRATHRPGRDDAAGWGRQWTTGHLSTAFPDGRATAAFRKGYFEARMLLPAGAGTWPSFWLLDQNSIQRGGADGAVEIDVVEGYGHAQTSYVVTEHNWPPEGQKDRYARHQRNVVNVADVSLAFHDYGVELTDDTVIYYFDGREVFRAPLFQAEKAAEFYMMTTLAMSHDWPIDVPPSGYYDLWISHIRVYK